MLGTELVTAVLEDWTTAPLDDRLRAACGLIDVLSRDPAALAPTHLQALRKAGISRDGITLVAEINALFSMITRVADTLGFEMFTPEQVQRSGRFLLKRGYG